MPAFGSQCPKTAFCKLRTPWALPIPPRPTPERRESELGETGSPLGGRRQGLAPAAGLLRFGAEVGGGIERRVLTVLAEEECSRRGPESFPQAAASIKTTLRGSPLE